MFRYYVALYSIASETCFDVVIELACVGTVVKNLSNLQKVRLGRHHNFYLRVSYAFMTIPKMKSCVSSSSALYFHDMPSLVTPAKRSRDSESDHDDSDLRILQASSSAAKRQRLALRRSKPTDSGNTLMTASSKHQPGAIIRVKLKNFVTYKDAEFYPGPSLNMVIGPNGNGKSTLVCAICLGLGWGSQVRLESIRPKLY